MSTPSTALSISVKKAEFKKKMKDTPLTSTSFYSHTRQMHVTELRKIRDHYREKKGITIIINGETEYGKSIIQDKIKRGTELISAYQSEKKIIPYLKRFCPCFPFQLSRHSQFIINSISSFLNEKTRSLKENLTSDEEAALLSICQTFSDELKDLFNSEIISQIRELEQEIEDCCLYANESLSEVTHIQQSLAEDDRVGYVFTNNTRFKARHFEVLIITKKRIIQPVVWPDTRGSLPTEIIPIHYYQTRQFTSSDNNGPQVDMISCGTLGLLYLKQLLKENARQLEEGTLSFPVYSQTYIGYTKKLLFFPSPHVLQYTQYSLFNQITRALLNDDDTFSIPSKEGQINGETLQGYIKSSLVIARGLLETIPIKCFLINDDSYSHTSTYRENVRNKPLYILSHSTLIYLSRNLTEMSWKVDPASLRSFFKDKGFIKEASPEALACIMQITGHTPDTTVSEEERAELLEIIKQNELILERLPEFKARWIATYEHINTKRQQMTNAHGQSVYLKYERGRLMRITKEEAPSSEPDSVPAHVPVLTPVQEPSLASELVPVLPPVQETSPVSEHVPMLPPVQETSPVSEHVPMLPPVQETSPVSEHVPVLPRVQETSPVSEHVPVRALAPKLQDDRLIEAIQDATKAAQELKKHADRLGKRALLFHLKSLLKQQPPLLSSYTMKTESAAKTAIYQYNNEEIETLLTLVPDTDKNKQAYQAAKQMSQKVIITLTDQPITREMIQRLKDEVIEKKEHKDTLSQCRQTRSGPWGFLVYAITRLLHFLNFKTVTQAEQYRKALFDKTNALLMAEGRTKMSATNDETEAVQPAII